MRRRHATNVWPAITDLMTSLAVVGLGLALVGKNLRVDRQRLAELEIENIELRKRLAQLTEQRDHFQAEVRRLSAMQRAVEIATSAMNEVAVALGQQPSDDLSVSFGEELVSFSLNQVQPELQGDGRATLHTVCSTLFTVLGRHDPQLGASLAEVARVVVEGHTDDQGCPTENDCNWRISAERAVNFRLLMARPDLCPGSADWTILPLGLAGSQPRSTAAESRRIQIRVLPDYAAILSRMKLAGAVRPETPSPQGQP